MSVFIFIASFGLVVVDTVSGTDPACDRPVCQCMQVLALPTEHAPGRLLLLLVPEASAQQLLHFGKGAPGESPEGNAQ